MKFRHESAINTQKHVNNILYKLEIVVTVQFTKFSYILNTLILF